MKALLSAYSKKGLVELGRALRDAGFELLSTGSTGKALSDAGLPVSQVSDLTGFPEMLDGRVKTLHPKVHGGILARRDLPDHLAQLAAHGIDTIDVVVGNLYPFVDTVSRPDATLQDALEKIDIGGPTLVRAAAKNFPHVMVVVDPADFGWIAERLADRDAARSDPPFLTFDERRSLARKAFQHVALYDTSISQYLSNGDPLSADELTLGFAKLNDLRYGENPHQQASLYVDPLASGGIVRGKQLHGIDMSFTNILDADAAWTAVSDFAEPAATVVKHTNPCGLAAHPHQPTAYQRAFEGDSVSAFGGIVGFNRTLTAETAGAMKGVLLDIIVAPDYEPEALEILRKRKRTRVIQVAPTESALGNIDVRRVSGGALVQTGDVIKEDPSSWKVVTKRKPTDAQLRDMAFAIKAMKHVRSNSIVLAKDAAMVGMGAGQPNRVTSVHLALRVAGEKAKDSVMASDAFFPFPDGVELAGSAGVAAVSQPGGSLNDEKVIEAADGLDLVMVFTGVRHFKH